MIKLVRNIKTAVNSIGSYKFQSTLSCLGIMFGAMSLVCMLSIGLGSRVALIKQLESLGENVIIVIPGQMSGRTSFGSKQETLKPDDVEIIKAIEGVKFVSPGIASSFPVVGYFGDRSKPEVTGVAPSFMEIRKWQLQEGRFVEDYDIDTFKEICVIGQTVARDLFFNINPVGESLSIGGKDFEVVGLLEPKGFSMSGRDQDNVIYIPFTTMQVKMLNQKHISFALASAVDKESINGLHENIKLVLREQHRLGYYEDDDFTGMNQSEFSKQNEAMTRIMTTLLGLGSFTTLVSGGIGIMNILLASTRERTREIGLRMAIGARRKDVLSQFFMEGLVISFGGAMAGVIIGNGISAIVSAALNWSMLISPIVSIASLLVSASVGLFFAYWPARKASRLNPIDALKYE